jgi:hypothetical protein
MGIQDEEDTIWVNENGYLLFFISEKKHNFGRDFLFLKHLQLSQQLSQHFVTMYSD